LHPFLRAIDYPLSLLASPIVAMLAAVMGVIDARRRPLCSSLTRGFVQVGVGTVLLALPAALTSLWLGAVCEPLYGLLFLLLGPMCSGWMGLILGHTLGSVLRPGLALVLLPLLLIGSVAIALAEFVWSPGVRFYGTLFGLYHGAVYDEAVFVELPYLWLRIWNLSGALSLIATLIAYQRSDRRWWTVAGLAALFWIGGGLGGTSFGFINSTSRVEAELSGTLDTAHFRLRFKPDGKAARWAPLMALDLEYRGQQILEFYDLPEPTGKVTAFIYETPQHKASLMGAGRTSIAKPWLRQVHIHTHSVGGRLLHHELAHALLADASDSIIGMPTDTMGLPRPGILEGAAVAVERGGETLTTHQWARAMRDVGLLPDMPAMLEQFSFWSQSSSRAYTACGSFIRYLVESRGAAPFQELYRGAGFARAYGVPLESLLAKWHEYLDSMPLSADDLELAEFAFARPPVFQRQCPYAGGRCLRRSQKAAGRGHGQEVASHVAQGLRVTDVDLSLGRRLARVLLAVGSTDEALSLLEIMHRRHPDPGVITRQSLQLLQGDAMWLQEEPQEALEIFAPLHESAFARMVYPAVQLRLALLAEDAPVAVRRLALGALVRRDLKTILAEAEEALPQLGPAGSLQVLLVMSRVPSRHASAMDLVTIDLVHRLPVELRWKARLLLLQLAVMQSNVKLARATVQSLRHDAHNEARTELLVDWEARIRWLETAGGGAYSQAGSKASTSAEAGSISTRTD